MTHSLSIWGLSYRMSCMFKWTNLLPYILTAGPIICFHLMPQNGKNKLNSHGSTLTSILWDKPFLSRGSENLSPNIKQINLYELNWKPVKYLQIICKHRKLPGYDVQTTLRWFRVLRALFIFAGRMILRKLAQGRMDYHHVEFIWQGRLTKHHLQYSLFSGLLFRLLHSHTHWQNLYFANLLLHA